ncbi:MAG: histidine--tRNA ligase, partial [Defluviitaleaceae bacterium]|nr:histidine--tRNA ligase [Defluviitaleaceae bacterium]
MQIKRPKGTADTFGVAVAQWQYIEGVIREVTSLFGASEIRTPTFESVDLFRQSVGEDTDIVQKEMYTFKDQGDREYVLKPEVTAGAVRAYLENSIYAWPAPAKLYYVSPVYRAERPQKGRLRQHHQFGCEYFGVASPKAEAELISMVWAFFEKLGIEGVTLRVNSVGDPSCRVAYNKALLDYLNPKADKLCELCQSRMGKNPMRVLDCKNPNCKETVENAPYP